MSVTVQCFHCNAVLDLDDGFRGGVCRCSNCGSLLQVPQGDPSEAPAVKKIRPATPPSPNVPTTPAQNATSSKLDVGISRGQFDPAQSSPPQSRRADLGLSSGIGTGRIHQTTPVAAAPPRAQRRRSPPAQIPAEPEIPPAIIPATLAAHPQQRSRALLWLGILLAFLITAVLATLVIYYVYYYEPPMPLPRQGG